MPLLLLRRRRRRRRRRWRQLRRRSVLTPPAVAAASASSPPSSSSSSSPSSSPSSSLPQRLGERVHVQRRPQVQPGRQRRGQGGLPRAGPAADEDDQAPPRGEEAGDAAEAVRGIRAQAFFFFKDGEKGGRGVSEEGMKSDKEPFSFHFLQEKKRKKERLREKERKGKSSPQLLEHGKQLRLHVLLPYIQHARID